MMRLAINYVFNLYYSVHLAILCLKSPFYLKTIYRNRCEILYYAKKVLFYSQFGPYVF